MTVTLAILTLSLDWGGVERTVSNLSLHLPDDRIKKYLILYKNKIVYDYKGTLINLNLPPAYESSNPFIKLIGIISVLRTIKRCKRELGIHVTLSMPDVPNFNNILSRASDKVIISVRTLKSHPDCDKKSFYSILSNFLIGFLYNRADVIVANSQGVKRDLVSKFCIREEKIQVIYNMFDTDVIQKLSKENLSDFSENFFRKHKVIINVGRLSKEKGQWHLLKIFRLIKDKLSDVKLIILGDGELRAHLIDLANKLKFKVYSVWNDRLIDEDYDVYFLGFQKNPFKFIAKSHIFILPSILEGFPNVLVEAMACGIPVLASDCGSGAREILAPDTDFMFKAKQPEYAKYGLLMPICDRNIYAQSYSFSREERIWSDIVIQLIKDENMRNEYSILAKKRASDFAVNKIINEWLDRICKLDIK